jgi:hypothetical protein
VRLPANRFCQFEEVTTMPIKSRFLPALFATAFALAATAVPASAGGVKVGVLTCQVAPGVGLVLGSSKRVSCDFSPNGFKTEHYSGRITKLGVDVGFTTGGVIVWGVFAAHEGYSRYALPRRQCPYRGLGPVVRAAAVQRQRPDRPRHRRRHRRARSLRFALTERHKVLRLA